MSEPFLLKPVSNEEAMDFIRSKPLVSQRVFARMLPELKARAFVISGIELATVAQNIRDRLAELPAGADWDDIKADIVGKMSPFLDDSESGIVRSLHRAELLLRTHGFQAYQAAQYNVMQEVQAELPYWQYVSMEDEHVRASHAALDGLILPADHPFWQTHFPPWEWGCRCQVVPISQGDMEEVADGSAQYGRVLSDVELRELEQSNRLALPNGQVIDVSSDWEKGREGAFYWHPGDLRIPLDQLRGRYDDEVWKAFEDTMKAEVIEGKVTAWEWLNGGKILPPTASVVPVDLQPETISSVLKDLGLAQKKAWTADEVKRLVSALKEDVPVKASDFLKSPLVVGADKKGAFSQKSIAKHRMDVLSMLPPDVAAKLKDAKLSVAVVSSLGEQALAEYDHTTKTIRLSRTAISEMVTFGNDPDAHVRERIYHEMMHWVHVEGPAWYRDAIDKLWEARTGGEKTVWLDGYNCHGKRDKWWDAYAGRVYSQYGFQGLEVVTRHFQLLGNPQRMADVMEHNPNGTTVAENLSTVLSVFFRRPV